jgi:hypothetical protein
MADDARCGTSIHGQEAQLCLSRMHTFRHRYIRSCKTFRLHPTKDYNGTFNHLESSPSSVTYESRFITPGLLGRLGRLPPDELRAGLLAAVRSNTFTDLNPNERIPFVSVRSPPRAGFRLFKWRKESTGPLLSTSAAFDRWMRRRLPSPRTCATPNILVSPHDPQTHGHVPTWNFFRVGRR